MGVWFGAGTAQNTAALPDWTHWQIGEQNDVPGSSDIPTDAQLYVVSLEIAAVNTATAVELYVTYDEAGLQPITPYNVPAATQDISVIGAGGSVAWRLDVPLVARAGAGIWVHARPDADTLTGARPYVTARNVQ